MTKCLLRASLGALSLLAALSAPLASARDASYPHRNQPGFTCHRWNQWNECVDFSYFDARVAPLSYGGMPLRSAAFEPPVYVLPGNSPVYTQPVYRLPTYTQPVYRCQNARVDCTGSVTLRVSGAPKVVTQGDAVTYNLYVRNDDSQERIFDIQAYLDVNMTYESSTPGAFDDDRTVRWTEVRMPARTSQTFTLKVRISNTALTLTEVMLRAQADRSVDQATTTVRSSGYARQPIRVVPQYDYNRTIRRGYTYSINQDPFYYYDQYGNLQFRVNTARRNDPYFYCDPSVYVCR